jgi:uncharacterized protein (DUF1697 family)
MTVHISLLRGINVSGQKAIKMADLRMTYQSLGFENVESYIQSGNVLFTSSKVEPSDLATQINTAIFAQYGFDVPIFILTPAALQNARNNLPFDDIDVAQDGSKVLLCFLSQAPSNSIELLTPYLKSNERIAIIDNVLYLHCQDGVGRSKLSHSQIEKKLQVSATARNLKTVDKLLTMVNTCPA